MKGRRAEPAGGIWPRRRHVIMAVLLIPSTISELFGAGVSLRDPAARTRVPSVTTTESSMGWAPLPSMSLAPTIEMSRGLGSSGTSQGPEQPISVVAASPTKCKRTGNPWWFGRRAFIALDRSKVEPVGGDVNVFPQVARPESRGTDCFPAQLLE